MAMLQLILGNIGVRGGGMNALRGHSNIQGLTDIGLMSHLHPRLPERCRPRSETRLRDLYGQPRQFKPLRPGQTSYWQNYSKFLVSVPQGDVGRRPPRPRTTSPINWLPKLDVPAYDVLRACSS
jgi:formate dehydrogenase major subunit